MSDAITLEEARAQLRALLCIPQDGILQTTVNGTTTIYRSLKEVREQIEYWERKIVTLQNIAAGRGGLSFMVGNLSSNR